jgi:GT2 family glycosyltransferase
MRFTVIIPGYQSHKTILRCLTGLKEQVFQDFEAIFVDSSRDSGVKEIIESNSSYPVIRLSKQTLSDIARNLAAEKARGDILVFLDSDCVPRRDWLLQADAAFRNGAKAISGPVLCYGNKSLDLTAHLSKFWLWLPDKNKKHVETAPTANFAVSKELFNAIGGLDPNNLASSDTKFCYEIGDLGVKIPFINSFVVEHIHDTTFKSLYLERFDRGKQFGIMREQLKTWTKWKSLIFVLSIFLLPGKNLILKLVVVSKSGYFIPFMKAFFAHLMLEHAWMYGQFGSHFNNIFKKSE